MKGLVFGLVASATLSAPAMAWDCVLSPEYTITAVGSYASPTNLPVVDAGSLFFSPDNNTVTAVFDDSADGEIHVGVRWTGVYRVDDNRCNGYFQLYPPNQAAISGSFHGDGNFLVGLLLREANTQVVEMHAANR